MDREPVERELGNLKADIAAAPLDWRNEQARLNARNSPKKFDTTDLRRAKVLLA
ncbi:hypothetical protein [Bradyrhizobium sp. dw_411]|uniref:hypothetical protein n=1 Tax=Bradyrhizobium sp. dw_411 TaxID=2720082 RepID=UPI001BCAA960|nr:hypothetical protein [Bradyrhizobium sp. dw_411]